jgi:hypothetical protein
MTDDGPDWDGFIGPLLPDDEPTSRKMRVRRSVTDMLPRLVFDRALGPALKRRLSGRTPLAVIVQAPGADWCDPLRHAADAQKGSPHVVARDGTNRTGHKPDLGNGDVAAWLRGGEHVIGISQAPDRYLPATLSAIADARVVAKSPDGKMIKRLIFACTGTAPRSIPDDVAAGLGYHEIVSAFRAGATPSQVVSFLAAASSAKCGATVDDETPTLDRLPGCDLAARDWGMTLAREYSAWRRGELPWKAVSGSASAVLTGPPGTGKTMFAKSLAKTL